MNVSPSGFYAWQTRESSARDLDDQELLKKITKVYWESEGRYGSPRVFKALKADGIAIGEKRVARLMQKAGLIARCMKVVKRTPNLKAFQRSGENLLLDQAMPTGINQVWVGDITYIKLNNQWRYLATVMDLYSRRIIAWSLSDNRRAELTIRALKLALRKRNYPKGLIFHSDRGIEYLSNEYRNELKRYGVQQSFNRAYHCTDNAFMESFFHSLKGELIRGTDFKSDASLRAGLANYINGFYNTTRLHSSINYLSPIEYERRAA